MMADQDFVPPQWLDKSYLQSVLNSKYGQDVEVSNFAVKVATKKGDNYTSEMFRIVVTLVTGEKHHLILKKTHTDKDKSSVVDVYGYFEKEIKFYTKYLPKINEILRYVDEYEEITPELIFCDPETEVIILDDLSNKGYAPGDRANRLCRESGKCVIRKLAKYHAATLVLNKRLNGALEEPTFETFSIDGPYKEYMTNHPYAVLEAVTSWGDEFAHLIPKLEKIAKKYRELAHEATVSKRGLNVLVHGDIWYTNVLVKKHECIVEDIRLIDFQLNCWASLAVDILYFVFRSLNEEDYETGFDYLIEIYHENLARVLEKIQYFKVPTLKDIKREIHDQFFHGKKYYE